LHICSIDLLYLKFAVLPLGIPEQKGVKFADAAAGKADFPAAVPLSENALP